MTLLSTLIFLAALAAAAPTFPAISKDVEMDPRSLDVVSDYFNAVAAQAAEARFQTVAPACELSTVQMPAAPTPLPPPSSGLSLKHIAVGRGTQNYTCPAGNATAAPATTGAVATLFNASCVAAAFPDMLAMLPAVALQFDLDTAIDAAAALGPSNLAVSGHHFFTPDGKPYFNLDTESMTLGNAVCAKLSGTNAPPEAVAGRGGEVAVPWLKLGSVQGRATGNLREVYRLTTAGGSAPATCEGMPETFEVQYAAAYWFFEGPDPADAEPAI